MREFRLPDVGEGISEGELVQWLVAPGDEVTEDMPVAEVETDKALVEIPSPVDGTVRELRAEAGEMVPVGDVLIVFDEAGSEPAAPAGAESDADAGASEPPPGTESERATGTGGTDTAAAGDGETAPDGRVFAPPHVKRLARELGVDLGTVTGSGPGGRVTEGDVRAAAEATGGEPDGAVESAGAAGGAAGAPTADDPGAADASGTAEPNGPATETPPSPEAAPERDRTLAVPATRGVARELDVDIDAVPAVEERDGEAFVTADAVREYAEAQRAAQAADAEAVAGEAAGAGEATATAAVGEPDREERVPYRGLRRTIGERMTESKYTAPHVTHHDAADATALVEARSELRPRAEDRGIRLTYLPFVMRAVVAALEEFPALNAELDEGAEEIVRKGYYNLGVAVATDAGLMVPVVDDVDRKGLLQLSSEVNELAEKARERTVEVDELRGSTFTITNFGAIGGEYATPIINYPEVAILGLGAIEKRPVVVDDEVVPRHTLPLSLSIDHRVVDGAVAAQFANRLIEYLENPLLLLLD